jgi:hypothetical protein
MPFRKASSEIRRGTKVIAVTQLGKIPEGTVGTIKLIDGFGWIRYWVSWETGEWMGSVDAGDVVAANRYEEYKREQLEKATRAASAPVVVAAATSAAAAPDGGGGDSRVPEHLLERSRARRAALSA